MQKQYRAEFFTREFEYIAHRPMENPTIFFDYLTLESVPFAMPAIEGVEEMFVRVVSQNGAAAYEGVVGSVKESSGISTVRTLPLLSLLDISVNYDRTLLQTGSIENFLQTVICNTYRDNPDTLQNLAGVRCVVTSSTPTLLNIKSNVHELWDICTKAFSQYSVVVSANMDIQAKEIVFTIGKMTETRVIETYLLNCLSKNIVIGNNRGSLNKATYINKNNEAERVTYYLSEYGAVSTTDLDRISPVVFKTEYVEMDDFATDAYARALEDLTPRQYNNLIELTYRAGDNLLAPEDIPIGASAVILTPNMQYASIFTGYETWGNQITLTFGVVREDLTKILIMNRRNSDAG